MASVKGAPESFADPYSLKVTSSTLESLNVIYAILDPSGETHSASLCPRISSEIFLMEELCFFNIGDTFIQPVSHPIVNSAWYTRYSNLMHRPTGHIWFVEDIVLFDKHYSTSWHKHSMLEILLNMAHILYISHTNFYQGKVSI